MNHLFFKKFVNCDRATFSMSLEKVHAKTAETNIQFKPNLNFILKILNPFEIKAKIKILMTTFMENSKIDQVVKEARENNDLGGSINKIHPTQINPAINQIGSKIAVQLPNRQNLEINESLDNWLKNPSDQKHVLSLAIQSSVNTNKIGGIKTDSYVLRACVCGLFEFI